jgi:hypothetical protein
VRYIKAFGRFWWDFVVGEDWRIAAGVAVVLAAGALVVAETTASDALVTCFGALGIVGVAVGSIVHGARAAGRRGG